jgi:ABC-type transport system substrate-binding protein
MLTPLRGSEIMPSRGIDRRAAEALLSEMRYLDTDGDGVREKDGKTLTVTLAVAAGNRDALVVAKMLRRDLFAVGIRLVVEQVLPVGLAWDGVSGTADVYLNWVVRSESVSGMREYMRSATDIDRNGIFAECEQLRDTHERERCVTTMWQEHMPVILLYQQMFYHGISGRVRCPDAFFGSYTPLQDMVNWELVPSGSAR